jgi:accessory gene regulator B
MDTFGRCTIVSIVLFIAIAWISQNTYHIWSQGALIIFAVFSFILTLIILIKRAPVSNHNRQISSKEEIEKFRRLFKMYMFLWAVAVCILFMLDLKMFVLTASLAILLEAFLISKPGHNFFSFINDGFSIAGK